MLDAVVELIRAEGPYVSMEQIAAACGVTKPIVYRHFDGRDGVVRAVAGVFVADLIALLGTHLTEDRSALDLLVVTMDGYLALIERDPNVYRFATTNVGSGNLDLAAALVAEQIAVVMEGILADRDLPTDAARTWAHGLVGMVHFAADQWIDEPTLPRRTIVEQLTTLLWVGFEGIGVGDRPPRPPIDLPLEAGDRSPN